MGHVGRRWVETRDGRCEVGKRRLVRSSAEVSQPELAGGRVSGPPSPVPVSAPGSGGTDGVVHLTSSLYDCRLIV